MPRGQAAPLTSFSGLSLCRTLTIAGSWLGSRIGMAPLGSFAPVKLLRWYYDIFLRIVFLFSFLLMHRPMSLVLREYLCDKMKS